MPEGRKRLEGAMRDLLGGKQDKPRLFPGALGAYVDGVKQLKVQGRPDFVYVRLRGATSEVIHAFNDAVGLHWDLPVLVYRDPLAKYLWRIYARDIGQYEDWGGASYLPPHGLSHSFVGGVGGGVDTVWVQKRQFMPLLGRPDTSGSMSVWVEPDYYYWDDLYHYWPGSGTSSLLGSKPTGTHTGRFVTVYLDGDNGILRTLNGVEFDIVYPPSDPSLYIPVPTGSVGIPIVAVFLTTGTDRIGWGELYDLREVVSPPHAPFPVSGISGSVVVQDEGIVKGSVPILDFVGAGVTAAVAAGKATITIPGFVTGSVVVEDEGVVKGLVPILDFVGAGVTAGVAGGLATITIPGESAFPHTGTVVLLDGGIIQGSVTQLDFLGGGVAAAAVGTKGEVVINPMMILDETAPQGYATVMDFQGAGVGAVVAAGQATVTIPGGGAVSLPCTGTVVVEDEGIIRGSAPILDFVGGWVAAGVAGGVATIMIPPVTGSATVINEAGVDADVRFEGDTDPNLLTLDAGLDRVGIGIATPDGKLHVQSASAGAVTADPDYDELVVEGGSNTGLSILAPDGNRANLVLGHASDNCYARLWTNFAPLAAVQFESKGNFFFQSLNPGYSVVFNEDGIDQDTRFEGDTATQLLLLDAGLDAVRIGSGVLAGTIADFRASGVFINPTGLPTVDFTAAGETQPQLLWADASADKVYYKGVEIGATPCTGTVVVEDEGLIRGSAPILDFVGPWVAAGVAGGVATVTIPPVTGSSTVVNEAGADADIRFEGDTDANLLTLDAGLDTIGIGGVGISGQKLSVYGDMQASEYTGWNFANETWTRTAATTFTVPTDLTAKYQKGTKIKLTDTTTKYFYVTASSYSAPNTTVTVTGGSDYSLVGAISNPFYSYIENPRGFPGWFNYAPTITGFSPNPGDAVYRFRISGRTVYYHLAEGSYGTSNNTSKTYSLPVTAATVATQIRCGTIITYASNGVTAYGGIWYLTSAATALVAQTATFSGWSATGNCLCWGQTGNAFGSLVIYEI